MFKEYIIPFVMFFTGVILCLYYVPDKNMALTLGSLVGTIFVYSYKRIFLKDTFHDKQEEILNNYQELYENKKAESEKIRRHSI